MFGRRSRVRKEQGSVAVEAAIILPVLILVLFGIVEFSMALRDHVALTSAVRSAARTASAEPRLATFATDAVDAAGRAGTALPLGVIEELWVFEANAGGFPTNNGSINSSSGNFVSCTTRCLRFVKSGQNYVVAGGTWDHLDINACPGDPEMSNVGVYIRARHDFVTGLFGASMMITDNAVLRFEPIPASQLLQSGQCKP